MNAKSVWVVFRKLKTAVRMLIYEWNTPFYLRFGIFKFRLRFSKISYDKREYLINNIDTYESAERKLIEKLVKKGDNVIEGGTSIGLISGLISKLIGPTGRLISIEPDERLSRVARSINKASNAQYIVGAFLPTSNEKQLKFKADGWLGGIVTEAESINNWVPVYTLEDLKKIFTPNCLVLDIEGSEESFLKVDRLDSSIEKIIIELHPSLFGEEKMELLIAHFIEVLNFKITDSIKNVYALVRNDQKK